MQKSRTSLPRFPNSEYQGENGSERAALNMVRRLGAAAWPDWSLLEESAVWSSAVVIGSVPATYAVCAAVSSP
ncbi:hypothetical protein BJX63DRAFT_396256 [Aspergillus granulosus]|uniref:Uncharacterized protein n=1 Tax=Aspergillus granulosus TaxID=176169 RepID=A0ABR4HAZ4_9EURO